MNETRAFLTGSRRYGRPSDNSDYDVVVLVDDDTLVELNEACDERDPTVDNGYISLRFGKLNLIALTDEREFGAWKEGTDELYTRRPVTREDAKQVLKSKCKEALGGTEKESSK